MDERSLAATFAFVGLLYLVIVAVVAVGLMRRASGLLLTEQRRAPAAVWTELAAPGSVTEALNDPDRRWTRFLRSGDHRTRLSTELVWEIDGFRRVVSWSLVLIAGAGVLVIAAFVPLILD